MRLLDARKLIAYIDGGGIMQRRQELEAQGIDVFADGEAVRGTMAQSKGRFAGMIAVSYAWIRIDQPDPEGEQLLQLRNPLEYWCNEREAAGEGATVLLIDFMCMHQPDAEMKRTDAETSAFRRALFNIGVLYGHAGTAVMKITETPAGSDPDRVYNRRGWTHLEKCNADLIKPVYSVVDVSAWNKSEIGALEDASGGVGYDTRYEIYEAKGKWTTEPDSSRTAWWIGTDQSKQMRMAGRTRGPPRSPSAFEEELAEVVFGYESDRKVCADLYARTAVPLLASQEAFEFSGLPWSPKQFGQLGAALGMCEKLGSLSITLTAQNSCDGQNGWDPHVESRLIDFFTAVGAGPAVPSLRTMVIDKEQESWADTSSAWPAEPAKSAEFKAALTEARKTLPNVEISARRNMS